MTRELFLTDLQGKGPPIMKQDSIVEDNMRERGRGKKGEHQRRSAFLSTGKQKKLYGKDNITYMWWKLDQVTSTPLRLAFQFPEQRPKFGSLHRNQDSPNSVTELREASCVQDH